MRLHRTVLLASALFSSALSYAQVPVVSVDPQRHGNLAAAQEALVQAYSRLSDAQRVNGSHLGGHAERAKELLSEADKEIMLAANQSYVNVGITAPAAAVDAKRAPVNVSGAWTIYAYNVSQPGSSLKDVDLQQDGNILTGTFQGPHQKGKLQGWVSGNHVEFSTDTREVLTFRGEVTGSGMSGLYGIHGEHAPFKAQRK